MINVLTKFRSNVPTAQLFSAALGVALVLPGCSLIKTTASVTGTAVSTTAKVAGTVASTTVDVAKAGVTTGVVVGSAGVTAASTAKSVSLATASVAIAGVGLAGNAIMWGIALRQNDEFGFAPVTSAGGGRFVSVEGRVLEAPSCEAVPAQSPATLVHTKSGSTEIRYNGERCHVTRVDAP